ncbi:hypothetical protein [Streptomyces swartbergensis]|uniref:hypothetical protein n=1 Tax=Streptomyces swartbergensis TaxID=487165 RepID=UPI002683AB63
MKREQRDSVTTLHSAFPPFSGEDYALSLYLERVPGTYTFLGVRAPGAPVTTSYPNFPDFAPDERPIAIGVRGPGGSRSGPTVGHPSRGAAAACRISPAAARRRGPHAVGRGR